MVKHWQHVESVDEHSYKKFSGHGVPIQASRADIPPNTAVFVENRMGGKRLEGVYDPGLKAIRPIRNTTAPNKELRLYIDALESEDITVIAVDGLMGTGKTSTCIENITNTHLSSLPVLKGDPEEYKPPVDQPKVWICKPVINSGGPSEKYGFLPGDLDEKLDPSLRNFIQYFDRFSQQGYQMLKQMKCVEILPLGMVRGLDIENTILVVDECQNTEELISVVSRKAGGSRVILLGDTSPFQIDAPKNTPTKNGLNDIIDLLQGAPYFQHIEMKSIQNIVRSSEVRDLVSRLFRKYGIDPQKWAVGSSDR